MNNIDWRTLPYDHQWEKQYDSIMAPGEKSTWPQFIVEMLLFNRERYIPNYPKVHKGPGWSKPIQKQVRALIQQAQVICNYFPSPRDEPLVVYATKKYFRNSRPLKIGQYRKTRYVINKKTGKEKCNITQDEKDIVQALSFELEQIIKTRNVFSECKPKPQVVPENITTSQDTQITPKPQKGTLASLIALENSLKSPKPDVDTTITNI